MPPLHDAARKGRVSEVVALLAGGADVDAENDHSSTRWTALHIASHGGHADVVRVLVDAGADVDKMDTDGWTPLYLAARHEDAAALKMLLAAGADPNLGQSPYFWALVFGHKSVLALLLQHGAAMVTTDQNGNAPRNQRNASAWRLHDKVVEAGGYDAFKRIHRRVYANLLPKVFEAKFGRRAPDDACGVVASFLSHGNT